MHASSPLSMSSLIHYFEVAAHQNAEGVVSLQSGDCGRAFYSLVSTLTTFQKLRQVLQEDQQQRQQERQEQVQDTATGTPRRSSKTEPPVALASASAPATSSPVSVCCQAAGNEGLALVATAEEEATTTTSNRTAAVPSCKAIPVPYLQDSGFFIYSNAVLFSRRPWEDIQGEIACVARTEEVSEEVLWNAIAFCEAATQFNLGLVYHQRGKHCGEDRALLGALQLYERAWATLERVTFSAVQGAANALLRLPLCMETKVLKLVVANNRIHILNELARYPQAQELVKDFMVKSVQTLSYTNLAFLTRLDIDHFLLNALVIRRFNTAPCA